jgi:ABC-type amino acid transport substrate-binding protein
MAIIFPATPMKTLLRYFLIAIFALLYLGISMVSAQSEKPTPLIIEVALFPPLMMKSEGELVGFDIDLARAVAGHLGRPIEFKQVGSFGV